MHRLLACAGMAMVMLLAGCGGGDESAAADAPADRQGPAALSVTAPSAVLGGAVAAAVAQASAAATTPAPAAGQTGLNDTGVGPDSCFVEKFMTSPYLVKMPCTNTDALALKEVQDGLAGRDASPATNGASDGRLGFSFSPVAGDCLKDNVTGLIWESKKSGGMPNRFGGFTNYDDTNQPQKLVVTGTATSYVNPTQAEVNAATNALGYVAAANAASLCGFSDWRLPTSDELVGLLDFSQSLDAQQSRVPAIDTDWFGVGTGAPYWTSTPARVYYFSANDYYLKNFANSVDFARYATSSDTFVKANPRSMSRLVRLVRGTPTPGSERFRISADGNEVTDTFTKLVWQRCLEGSTWVATKWTGAKCSSDGMFGGRMEQAATRARTASAATGKAWRVPNIKEIFSTINSSNAAGGSYFDFSVFPDATSGTYLTSTPWIVAYPGNLSSLNWSTIGGSLRLVRDQD